MSLRRHSLPTAPAAGRWFGLAALALPACSSPTDITVVVTTDFACAQLNGVTITLGTPGPDLEHGPAATVSIDCTEGDGGDAHSYAGRLVVVPSDGKNDLVAVKVVGGFGTVPGAENCNAVGDTPPVYGPGCIIARRAVRYTPHVQLTVPIMLRAACAGVSCGVNDTCVRGVCVSANIVDTRTCGGGAGGCDESVLVGDAGARAAP